MAELIHAAENGNLAEVRRLLAAGASPDSVDEQDANGITPMFLAAENGHLDVVKALIEAGADVNIKDSEGLTSIVYAGHMRDKKIVELLLKHPKTANVIDISGFARGLRLNRYTPEIRQLIQDYINSIKKRNEFETRLRLKPGFEPKNNNAIKSLGRAGKYTNIWGHVSEFIGPQKRKMISPFIAPNNNGNNSNGNNSNGNNSNGNNNQAGGGRRRHRKTKKRASRRRAAKSHKRRA